MLILPPNDTFDARYGSAEGFSIPVAWVAHLAPLFALPVRLLLTKAKKKGSAGGKPQHHLVYSLPPLPVAPAWTELAPRAGA
jgi:hypothetical protein